MKDLEKEIELLEKGELMKRLIITCPECGLKVEESNFLVFPLLKGEDGYECPDCGKKWSKPCVS